MSFQTVLSIVGVAFSAFEMYKRFRPKSSSPRAEPKQREAAAGATADAEPGKPEKAKLGESQAPTSETPRSAVSSKIGMA